MKLFYSALFLALFASFSVTAQIADYSVGPDWTGTDINGTTHNMYDLIDSGYAVFMDLSATWCGPCWTIHQNGLLQDLHDTYGPDGTNEMRIFYFESESSNTLDQLHGIGTAGGGANRATDTEGNWVGTHTFPFIDDASVASLYQLGAFPTLTLVGRDRLTRTWVGSPGPAMTDVYDVAQAATPLANGDDARVISYNGPTVSLCGDIDASVLIQNHGTTDLTILDFNILGDGANIGTYQWTGLLAPYQTTTVSLGAINAAPYAIVAIEIELVDEDLTNNIVDIEGLTVIQQNTLNDIFDLETTDPAAGLVDLPDGYTADPLSDFPVWSLSSDDLNNATHQVGGYEMSDFAMFFYFFQSRAGEVGVVTLDKVDVTAIVGAPVMMFNHAYVQYSTENDRLIIQASGDCGATWTNLFDEQGVSLQTGPAEAPFFVPMADDWTSTSIDLGAFTDATELIVRFVGISAFGNNLWVDDIKFEGESAVSEIPSIESLNLFPNPTMDISTLNLDLTENEDIHIDIVDMLGKNVKQVFRGHLEAGDNVIPIDVNEMTQGMYNVVVRRQKDNAVNTIKLQVQ